MTTIIGMLIAGLMLAGELDRPAYAGDAGDLSLDTPIKTIELDTEGNVARIEFGNDVTLADQELEPEEDIENIEILGVRRLPFHIFKDVDSGEIEVIVPCNSTTSVLTPEAEASPCLEQDVMAACPLGCRMVGGRCKCPDQLDAFRFPALVEMGESEFRVMMWPPE